MPAALSTSLRQPGPVAEAVTPSLLSRAGGGEPAALGRIYQLCQHRVRSFARRLLGDAAAAEDLVHDVFIHLPRLLGRYRSEAPFEMFLMSVVSRRAQRHLRTAMRRRRLRDRLAACAIPTTTSTPEGDTGRRELAAMLARALDSLSREHRTAFVLRDIEGLSAREAAQVAGVPEATIRTRVFHARRKLRNELTRLGVS
jgi:RNA polymerase sigma-70 factor (ECF subfamily)